MCLKPLLHELPAGSRPARPGRPLRSVVRVARHHEAGLVRVHDGLDAVAEVELGQDPSHVRLDRGLGQEVPVRDFGVGKSLRHCPQHLVFARGQILQQRIPCRARRSGGGVQTAAGRPPSTSTPAGSEPAGNVPGVTAEPTAPAPRTTFPAAAVSPAGPRRRLRWPRPARQ